MATPTATAPAPAVADDLILTPTTETQWKWRHLWLFGLAAWLLPTAASITIMQADLSFTQILDAALALQIVGYVIAVLIAAILVKRIQGGRWSSLGISFTNIAFDELGKGAGFGLLLLLLWAPIGFILAGGKLQLDTFTGALVGDTSGPGLLLAGIVLVVGAPVIEEIYYRGMLFTKFLKWGTGAAVFGTSILFVMAHGALFIPPLLVMGFGLGLMRLRKSLWYTIGAHGAWNFAVLCIAAYMFLGPSLVFSPPDEAYTLRYPANWQRDSSQEGPMPGGEVELTLLSTNQSVIAVGRLQLPPVPEHQVLPLISEGLRTILPGQVEPEVRGSNLKLDGLPATLEVTTSYSEEGVELRDTYLLALPKGAEHVYFFELVCPRPSCEQSQQEFQDLLKRVRFAR